ncbi:hypothetical protein [Glaciecola petra]|uniref:Uncharacterized protein n=1 Tax=Glaciecola petra TaxID=3075602 RepID=A0ABU2ZRU0_9ALTE|nr:hypothetical protein [Aestuariibacter sp. P117]MDT0595353.1 hypothetical protein [Aestuariibacter sp. P117]
MNAKPILPNNTNILELSIVNGHSHNKNNQTLHLNSKQVDYSKQGWEQRIAHDWTFFDIPAAEGRLLIIDISKSAANELPTYRYLANDNTQNQLYEPWSSSKIFAYTGAMAQLRKLGLSSNGSIGEHNIADMITSINSYEPFGKADGNSNALATFFANLATRDYLTDLFYDNWLNLSTPNIYFRGAYGPSAFEPLSYTFNHAINTIASNPSTIELNMNNIATDDPGYLPYRCEKCGLTGNKPMTTLAQAEWLKRLAMHQSDPVTAHPELAQEDILNLFYGKDNSQKSPLAGMTSGISNMLQMAIASNISDTEINDTTEAKIALDTHYDGKWRVFQKIGWGPSETRSTSENVVLAYVSLPHPHDPKQSRSFVVAAQVAVPEASEANVTKAGQKMQTLLNRGIARYMQLFDIYF